MNTPEVKRNYSNSDIDEKSVFYAGQRLRIGVLSSMTKTIVVLSLIFLPIVTAAQQNGSPDVQVDVQGKGAGQLIQSGRKPIQNQPKTINGDITAESLLLMGLNHFNVAEFMSLAQELDPLGKHHLIQTVLEALKSNNSNDVYISFVSNVDWGLIREHLVGKGFSNCPQITNTDIGRGCAVLLEQAQMQKEDEIMMAEINQLVDGFITIGSNPDQAYDQAIKAYHRRSVDQCKAAVKAGQKTGQYSTDKLLPTNDPLFKKGPGTISAGIGAGQYRKFKSNSEGTCVNELLQSGQIRISNMDFDPTTADNRFDVPPLVSQEELERLLGNTATNQGIKKVLVTAAKYAGAETVGGPAGIIVSELLTPERIGNQDREITPREQYEINNRKLDNMEKELDEIDAAVELLVGTKSELIEKQKDIKSEQDRLDKEFEND